MRWLITPLDHNGTGRKFAEVLQCQRANDRHRDNQQFRCRHIQGPHGPTNRHRFDQQFWPHNFPQCRRSTNRHSDTEMTLMKRIAAAALLLLSVSDVRAEGLTPTPWGWRAAPCCRENGVQGVIGRPPLAFTYGPLAWELAQDPAFRPTWAMLPPPPFAHAPPIYGPAPQLK
jgi:hypothetical protein